MTTLQLRLFGPLEVTAGLELVSGFDSDKVRALLAYLAVTGEDHLAAAADRGAAFLDDHELAAGLAMGRTLADMAPELERTW